MTPRTPVTPITPVTPMTPTATAPRAQTADPADFATAAAAIDAERDRLLEALAATRGQTRAGADERLIHSLARLNSRADELRATFFPQATALSIAHGTATTWSASGLMRTVWRKAAG
jgi:hypothetical protein